MSLLSRSQAFFNTILYENDREVLTITIFCKSLYAFLFIKTIFLWDIVSDCQRYFPFEFSTALHHIIYAPIKLAGYNFSIFLILILIFLVLGLALKVNYIIAAIIFWLSFNLSRFVYPVTNGSDYVLNVFLFLSIFLATTPVVIREGLRDKQLIFSNFAFLLCKIQLALIYALSGVDKLTSPAWRSGDAVYSITNLELFVNPYIHLQAGEGLCGAIAWTIIIFELTFPVLIWFERLRRYALTTGIIFHLAIVFILSLPDFGILMMLLYTLFIPSRTPRRGYESSLR